MDQANAKHNAHDCRSSGANGNHLVDAIPPRNESHKVELLSRIRPPIPTSKRPRPSCRPVSSYGKKGWRQTSHHRYSPTQLSTTTTIPTHTTGVYKYCRYMEIVSPFLALMSSRQSRPPRTWDPPSSGAKSSRGPTRRRCRRGARQCPPQDI